MSAVIDFVVNCHV